MSKEKPKVGQILYSLNVGNAARNTEQTITPVQVTEVGRKYFTIQHMNEDGTLWKIKGTKLHHLDTWDEKTEYCKNSKLYSDPQEWYDEKESDNLLKRILAYFDQRGVFSYKRQYSLPLLREVDALISKEEEGV